MKYFPSHFFAGWLDKLYLYESKTFLGPSAIYIGKQLLYWAGFFPSLVVEAFLLGCGYLLANIMNPIRRQLKWSEWPTGDYAEWFMNRAIAIVGSFTAILEPRLVFAEFVVEQARAGIVGGSKVHKDPKASIEYPTCVEDVQAILAKATRAGAQVSIRGAGKSQGEQFLDSSTEKPTVVMDLKHFNTIEVNPENKTVQVGVGCFWTDLQNAVNEYALAIDVQQASHFFSVGGSIGTGIHGWSKTGTIAQSIRSMTVLLPSDGSVQTITPDDELFSYIIGGYGGFGVVLSAQLQLVDNYPLICESLPFHMKDFPQMLEMFLTGEDIELGLFRLNIGGEAPFSRAFAEFYRREPESRPCVTPDLVEQTDPGTRLERIGLGFLRYFEGLKQGWWDTEWNANRKGQGMTRNDVMRLNMQAAYNYMESSALWLNELFVPNDQVVAFIEDMAELAKSEKSNLVNATLRFVKKETNMQLSYAPEIDMTALVICYDQPLTREAIAVTKGFVRQVNEAALKRGGKIYLPYQGFETHDQFLRSYPGVQQKLIDMKKAVDPNGVLMSGLLRKVILNQNPKPLPPFQRLFFDKSAATKFEKFLDSIYLRFDGKRLVKLLKKLAYRYDTHAEFFDALKKHIGEVKSALPVTILRGVQSLKNLKYDLLKQMKKLLMKESDAKQIFNSVEIGFPGRHVLDLRNALDIKGTSWVINDDWGLTAPLQWGQWTAPYHKTAPLDNYASITAIKTASIGLVTATGGFHHAPKDRLDSFIASVHRIITIGGILVLREHDVNPDKPHEVSDQAWMAHCLVNAVDGVATEEEVSEVRNFLPLREWKEKLEAIGFKQINEDMGPQLREGDPTFNSLIAFKKLQ